MSTEQRQRESRQTPVSIHLQGYRVLVVTTPCLQKPVDTNALVQSIRVRPPGAAQP